MPDPRPTLYGYPISHYCVSADRMLRYKQIPFEAIRVPYHDKSELLARTGQDYVPAIVSGEQIVTWKDIPDFLEAVHPRPTLYPGGHRAHAGALANWGHQVLEERVWRAVVTDVPPTLADEHERWTFEEFQTRARGPWHVLRARKDEFRTEMREYLSMVEELLEPGPWILEAPSLADFAIYGALSPLWSVGEPTPDDLPRLEAWRLRVAAFGPPAWQ